MYGIEIKRHKNEVQTTSRVSEQGGGVHEGVEEEGMTKLGWDIGTGMRLRRRM